jgi:hypothetical protein
VVEEERDMSIELTREQSEALAAETDSPVAVIDPRSNRTYRLVPDEVYGRLEKLLYDDSPWTPAETAALAGSAFGKLDDTDYSHYVVDSP